MHKGLGDEVVGATINTTGTLRVRATKVGAGTALAQIVMLVQEAQNSKAPGQRLADRAAFWLVLVAVLGGGATFVVWLLAGRPVSGALLFAITVVVVTCPDALGLATPTAIMVGTGLGAARAVLFENATAIETSKKIDVVVMDKNRHAHPGCAAGNGPDRRRAIRSRGAGVDRRRRTGVRASLGEGGRAPCGLRGGTPT